MNLRYKKLSLSPTLYSIYLSILFIFIFSLLVPKTSYSEELRVNNEKLSKAFFDAIKNQNVEKAVEIEKKIEKGYASNSSELLIYIEKIADLYMSKKNAIDAEILYKRQFEILENSSVKDEKALELVFYKLGIALASQKKYPEAEVFFKKALAIQEKTPNHERSGKTLSYLGIVFRGQSKFAEAETFLKRALKTLENNVVKDESALEETFFNLALILSTQEKNNDAEILDYLKKALAIQEKTPNHERLGFTNFFAGVYSKSQNKYLESEIFYKRYLAIMENTAVKNEEGIEDASFSLGEMLEEQGKYSEAEIYYKKALAIQEKAPSPKRVSAILLNLAFVCQNQKKYLESETFYKRHLEIFEKIEIKDGTGVEIVFYEGKLEFSAFNLGLVLNEQKKYSEAETYFKKALLLQEKVPDHERLHSTLAYLAEICQVQNKYLESEIFYKRILRIIENRGIKDESSLEMIFYRLGLALFSQNKYNESEGFFKKALAIQEKTPNHENLGVTLFLLGATYQNQNRLGWAEKTYKKYLSLFENSEQTSSVHYSSLGEAFLNLYTVSAVATKNLNKLEDYLKKSIFYYEKAAVDEEEVIFIPTTYLASLYYSRRNFASAEVYYKKSLILLENFDVKDNDAIIKTLSLLIDTCKKINKDYSEYEIKLNQLLNEPSKKPAPL